jgi:upstream activation factor subunit UAF30
MFAKYTQRIVEILKSSDLDKVSAKQIRLQIQQESGVDFGSQKSEFNKYITDLYLDLMDNANDFKSSGSKSQSHHSNAYKTEVVAGDDIVTLTEQRLKTSQDSSSPSIAPSHELQRQIDLAKPAPTVEENEVYIKEEHTTERVVESPEHLEVNELQSLQVSSRGKKKSKRVLSSDRVDSDEEPSSSKTKKRKTTKAKASPSKNSGWAAPCKLSSELASVVNSEELPRTQVAKKLWEYIKENGLQDPKDKRFIITDEKLHAVLGVKRVHFMKMNQYLAKHITKIETGSPKVTAAPRKKGGNGFTKMHQLSPPLTALLGVDRLPRTQVVKRLWEIIKQRKLQDHKNGTVINNDEEMQSVFKTTSMSMFQMNKVLVDNSSYWDYI